MSTSNFGERLKQLRREKNLTQEQLAEVFGVARNSIFSYETGRRIPDIEVLKSYAEYFGVTSDYLLGLSDNRTPETAAIGGKLGLSDEAIQDLTEMNESMKNAEYGYEERYYKRLLDTISILITEPFVLGALECFLFHERNEFIDFDSWYSTLEALDIDKFSRETEEEGIEPEKLCKIIDATTFQDSHEASQAMNMCQLQRHLVQLSEKIGKFGRNYYAKENKRQE